MSLTAEQINQISLLMDAYIERNRPPEHLRAQLDLGWRLHQQSVLVVELRPHVKDAEVVAEHPVAKASWVKRSKEWHIYWLRANLKWDRYQPLDTVVNLQRFIIELEKDPHNCFWG